MTTRRILLQYCQHGGSSNGLRTFVEEALPSFQAAHPHIGVTVQTRNARHPIVEMEYERGVKKTIGVKNLDADTVLKRVELLAHQSGRKHIKLHGQHSPVMSVQGVWSAD